LEAPETPPAGITTPLFDGNPERIRVFSSRQKDATGNNVTAIDVDVGTVITNIVGVVDYAFRSYTILPDPGAITSGQISGGRTPAAVSTPKEYQFTVASYNIERFFDTVDDAGISDVALTQTALNNRISKAKLGICQFLKTPDIVGVSEVENQSVLQQLASAINADATNCPGSPNYQAYLTEGNDIGGIDVGFLVKTAVVAGNTPRVSGISTTQLGKTDLLKCNGVDQAGSFLNDRPPLVLSATINAANGPSFPVTVIANHLRSLGSITSTVANACFGTDGNRVREKRKQQAEFLASVVQSRQNQNLVLVGDFNAFQFNDGYVDVVNTIAGTPAADNETVVSGDGNVLVTPSLINLINNEPAAERYSYVFGGNAQVLDHVLVNQALTKNKMVTGVRVEHARINADFAEDHRNDANSPIRLSDHDPAVMTVDAFDRIFADGVEGN